VFRTPVIEFYDRKEKKHARKKKEMDKEGRQIRVERLHRQTEEWMDGWMDGWMD